MVKNGEHRSPYFVKMQKGVATVKRNTPCAKGWFDNRISRCLLKRTDMLALDFYPFQAKTMEWERMTATFIRVGSK
jgi:hypothetical protein